MVFFIVAVPFTISCKSFLPHQLTSTFAWQEWQQIYFSPKSSFGITTLKIAILGILHQSLHASSPLMNVIRNIMLPTTHSQDFPTLTTKNSTPKEPWVLMESNYLNPHCHEQRGKRCILILVLMENALRVTTFEHVTIINLSLSLF